MGVFFIFIKGFFLLVSWLPFPLLYQLSDVVKFFLQHIVRYRKKIILENLKNSFPEKNQAEIRKIMRRYYGNLADITMEVIKLRSISPENLKKRVEFIGIEPFMQAFDQRRSVILAIGHCGNWEWAGQALQLNSQVTGYGVIKPLSNKYFNKYMESLRNRFNPKLTIPFRHTYRELIRHKQEGIISFNIIAADQTPQRDEINYWSNFLNQDTPFYLGIDKMARALDFSVYFLDVHRSGRGRYTGEFHLITDDPRNMIECDILEKYIRMLEASIRHDNANWLWSHRRWKNKRSVPEG